VHTGIKNGVGRFSIQKQSRDRNLRFWKMAIMCGVIESASVAKTRSIHQGAKESERERDECFCFGGGGAAINKRRPPFVRRICEQ